MGFGSRLLEGSVMERIHGYCDLIELGRGETMVLRLFDGEKSLVGGLGWIVDIG